MVNRKFPTFILSYELEDFWMFTKEIKTPSPRLFTLNIP